MEPKEVVAAFKKESDLDARQLVKEFYDLQNLLKDYDVVSLRMLAKKDPKKAGEMATKIHDLFNELAHFDVDEEGNVKFFEESDIEEEPEGDWEGTHEERRQMGIDY